MSFLECRQRVAKNRVASVLVIIMGCLLILRHDSQLTEYISMVGTSIAAVFYVIWVCCILPKHPDSPIMTKGENIVFYIIGALIGVILVARCIMALPEWYNIMVAGILCVGLSYFALGRLAAAKD